MKIIKAMKMIDANTAKPVWINPLNVEYFEEIFFHKQTETVSFRRAKTDVYFRNYSFVIEESAEWLAEQMEG